MMKIRNLAFIKMKFCGAKYPYILQSLVNLCQLPRLFAMFNLRLSYQE
ncbi:Hypothetical protein ABZS17G119_01757 [Kosakonia cowanii]